MRPIFKKQPSEFITMEQMHQRSYCLYFSRQSTKVARQMGFRADIVIENKVILEIKSVEALADIHYKQVLTYLKMTNIKLGMLINFNVPLIKNGIHRIVNKL